MNDNQLTTNTIDDQPARCAGYAGCAQPVEDGSDVCRECAEDGFGVDRECVNCGAPGGRGPHGMCNGCHDPQYRMCVTCFPEG